MGRQVVTSNYLIITCTFPLPRGRFSHRIPYSGAAKSRNPIPKESAVAAKAATADRVRDETFVRCTGAGTRHGAFVRCATASAYHGISLRCRDRSHRKNKPLPVMQCNAQEPCTDAKPFAVAAEVSKAIEYFASLPRQ